MVSPKKALLSDANLDLINLFKGIKKYPSEVWENYCKFGNSKADYHSIRGANHPMDIQAKAARILYLNRTCFKGMWRTNKSGVFNVGYGGQDRRWVINRENLLEVSSALKSAKIHCVDFEETILQATSQDFIFLDPPYRPGSKYETNDHYSGKVFTFEDQKRLAKTLKWATRNKIPWAMTNTSHKDVVKLYSGCYKLNFRNGTGHMPGLLVKRPGEVLISNYSIKGGREIS
jgi:DNA adenine methylase